MLASTLRPRLALPLSFTLASLLVAGCFPDFPETPAGANAGGAGAGTAGAGAGAGAGNLGGAAGSSGASGTGAAGGTGPGAGAGGTGASGSGGSSGAGPEALGKPCSQDPECPGLVCRFGYCRFPCSSDDTCSKGSICLGTPSGGACSLLGDGDSCAKSNCENGGLACGIDGRCRTACMPGVSCPFNAQQCIAGTCVSSLEDNFNGTWGSCSPEGASCGGPDGKTIALCNVEAPGVVLKASCDTLALCQAGIKAEPPSCAPSGCAEGAYRCSGSPAAQLERCKDDKTGYEPVATCVSASLCLAGVSMGKCAPAKCGPTADPPSDTNRCNGGDAEVCDGAQYVATPCNGLQCNPATASCFALDIDETEVTRAAYEDFLKTAPAQQGVCSGNDLAPDAACMNDPSVCDASKGDCSKHPQVCVDWCDARAYCEQKGRVLCGTVGKPDQMVALGDFFKPGQSAWMNACSSGGEYTWTHGNTWDQNTEGQYCNGSAKQKGTNGQTFEVGSLGQCHSPVASYKPARDLSGNVAEWENSCARSFESPDASLNDNCRIRGGSFDSSLGGKPDLRCDADATRPRSTRSPFIGFRCCGPT